MFVLAAALRYPQPTLVNPNERAETTDKFHLNFNSKNDSVCNGRATLGAFLAEWDPSRD